MKKSIYNKMSFHKTFLYLIYRIDFQPDGEWTCTGEDHCAEFTISDDSEHFSALIFLAVVIS